MKTIEIKIDDNKLDVFLTIINNLKDDIIKQFKIKEIEKDFEEINNELKLIKTGKKEAQNIREFLNEI
jgi:Ni2+-binding GTPase involved in maturation of urease and hydrogenase